MLDKDTNYIVSGLERSGTSLLMQILQAGGVPVAFDESSRPPDDNNPRGYYELEGGKIINRLREGSFPLEKLRGKFIKITAYGLKFLPRGRYKIIYSLRNIEEILDSMEKMATNGNGSRDEIRRVFMKLNQMIVGQIKSRDDVEVLFVNYNEVVLEPKKSIQAIYDFLGSPEFSLEGMAEAVDRNLYRNRR